MKIDDDILESLKKISSIKTYIKNEEVKIKDSAILDFKNNIVPKYMTPVKVDFVQGKRYDLSDSYQFEKYLASAPVRRYVSINTDRKMYKKFPDIPELISQSPVINNLNIELQKANTQLAELENKRIERDNLLKQINNKQEELDKLRSTPSEQGLLANLIIQNKKYLDNLKARPKTAENKPKEALPTKLARMLRSISDSTFIEDVKLRALYPSIKDVTKESFETNFNKNIHDLVGFLDDIDRIQRGLEYDEDGIPVRISPKDDTEVGQYNKFNPTEHQDLFNMCDDLRYVISNYLNDKKRIMTKTWGGALVQPKQNSFLTNADVLDHYPTYRNDNMSILLRKAIKGELKIETGYTLVDITNNYRTLFSTSDFKSYHPEIFKCYDYQDRVDAYYTFYLQLTEYFNKAIDAAGKDELKLEKVRMAHNTIHTIMYGTSNTDKSIDRKLLEVIDSCDSTVPYDDIKKELSEIVNFDSDNNLKDVCAIIDPEGNLYNCVMKYIADCIENVEKYGIFSIKRAGRTLLKPVMDGDRINQFYYALRDFIDTMKAGVHKKRNGRSQLDFNIDDADKNVKYIKDLLREPLRKASQRNRMMRIDGDIPAGLVASMHQKNIYDINNSGYTTSYKRVNQVEQRGVVDAIENKMLSAFKRNYKGVSDVIEFQPELSHGKTLIKELFVDSGLTLNEILIVMNRIKIDNPEQLKLFSAAFDNLCKDLTDKVTELVNYYRGYLDEAQQLDIEVIKQLTDYVKSVLVVIELSKNKPIDVGYDKIKKANTGIKHARMDFYSFDGKFETGAVGANNSFIIMPKKAKYMHPDMFNDPDVQVAYSNSYFSEYDRLHTVKFVKSKAREDAMADAFNDVYKPGKQFNQNKQYPFKDKYTEEYDQVYKETYDEWSTYHTMKRNVNAAIYAGEVAGREAAYQYVYNNVEYDKVVMSTDSEAGRAIYKYRFSDDPSIDPEYKELFETSFKNAYDDFVNKHKEHARAHRILEAERKAAKDAKDDAYKNVFEDDSGSSTGSGVDDTPDDDPELKDAYQQSYEQNFRFYEEKYREYRERNNNYYKNKRKEKINEYIDRLLRQDQDTISYHTRAFREFKEQLIGLFTDQNGNTNWEALFKYVKSNGDLDFVVMYKSGKYRNKVTKQTNAEIHTISIKNAEELKEFMTSKSFMYEFSIMDKTSILDLRKSIGHTGNNRVYKSEILNNLVAAREWISYYIMAPLKQFSLFSLGFTVTNAIEGFIKTAIEAGGNPVTIFKHYQTAGKLHKEYVKFSRAMTEVLEGSPFWRLKDGVKALQYESELGKLLFRNWQELLDGSATTPVARSVDEIKEIIALHKTSVNLPNYIKVNMLKGVMHGNIDFDDYARRFVNVNKFMVEELPKYSLEDYYFVNDFINSSASAAEFQNIIIAEDLDKTGDKAKGIKKFYKKFLFSDNWLGKNNPLRFLTPYAHLSMNSNIETINRLALYLNLGEQGYYKSEALVKVLTTHFNYGNKSQAEMGAELLYPFISYPLRNFTYWMRALAEHPSLLKTFIDFTIYNWDDEKDSVYNQTKITKGGIRLWDDVSIESGFSGYEALAFGGNALNTLTQRKLNPLIGVAIEGAKQLAVGESNFNYRFGRLPIISHVQTGKNLVESLIKGQPKLYDIAPSIFNEVYKNNRYYYANQGQYAYKSAYNRLYYTSGQRRTGINQIRNTVIR